MIAKRFARWLQTEMKLREENYATMAIATGLHKTTISDIVRHQRDVRLSTFIALCEGLGVDPAKTLKDLIK